MPETSTSSDAFLEGRGVPVELHDIEAELTRLWGPAADRAGGPDLENPHVTRVVLANLVVAGDAAESPRIQGVLDTVSARYPCRVIVLGRGAPEAAEGAGLTAEVSALCHLPAPGLPQVCSERIVLRAGPGGAALLPGAVRPLLEADLPFVLWWAGDPRGDEAVFRDLADECTRLILDLPDAVVDPAALRLGLDPKACAYARDVAWFGLTRWRELLAQLFDASDSREVLRRIDSVRIEAAVPSASAPPRLAAWLAAWLAGQLGWTRVGRPGWADGLLSAAFRGPSGEIRLEVVAETVPGLAVAELTGTTLTTRGPDGPDSFRLRRLALHSPEVRVEVDSPSYCTLPRVVLAPELDAPRRVAAALESSRHDPPFDHARPHALWLLGAD